MTLAPLLDAQRSAHAAPMPLAACELRGMPLDAQAELRAALEKAREDIVGMAGRLAADAAAARFAESREQVPAFGAWAYDWVQSYITSYRMLSQLIVSLADAASDEVLPRATGIVERMAEPMREEFRKRVVEPAERNGNLASDLRQIGSIVDIAWVEAMQDALRKLPQSPASPVMSPGFATQAPETTWSMALEIGDDPTAVFVRSIRPMAARVGVFVVRATEVGSAFATGGSIGYALGGASGLALGTVAGIGIYWGFDWVLNRLDAAWNRVEFEDQALRSIAQLETRFVELTRRTTGTILDHRIASLGAGRDGCREAAPGR